MNFRFKHTYKSITPFELEDIPMFVVITGKNGSGKSQLLELIYDATLHVQLGNSMQIENEKFKANEVILLKSEWNLTDPESIRISSLQKKGEGLFSQIKSFQSSNVRQSRKLEMFYRDLETLLAKPRSSIKLEEFLANIPEAFIKEDKEISIQIGEIFFNYRIDQIQMQADQFSDTEIIDKLGRKPWDVVREIIQESKLPFTINDPEKMSIRESFQLTLTHDILKQPIKFSELSSGEKVLMSMVIYLYNSQERKHFPKLLLLDEPDAHLHPSMTQQFLNVIKNVLVDKCNVRVFMTTHSPSTVMLSPIESLFEMSISDPRISKINNKNKAIAMLTSGLVFVGAGTKYFLVEDQDDVNFYTFNYQKLVELSILEADIPLVFIPVSTKDDSGGKNKVTNWVKKLQETGLENSLAGLIDRDSDNQASSNVYTLNRYAIENYLVDPLVIYCILLEKEKAPEILDLKLSLGEEYKIKNLSQEILQQIANVIFEQIEPHLGEHIANSDGQLIEVAFLSGQVLQYPKWIVDIKGKVILNNIYQNAFSSIVNYGTAFTAFKKLNMFPNDLVDKFKEIKHF